MTFNKKWAVVSALGSMISVQSGASIAKYLFHLLGPAGAVTLRVGLAGILLALVNRPKISRFSRKDWLCILVYGLSLGSMNLIFYYGIQRVPLGIGVGIEFVGPLGLALLCSRQALDFLWAVLVAAGILLIIPWKGGTLDPLGIVLVAAAGILWALYIASTGVIAGKIKNSDATTCGMCLAALLVLPFGWFSGDLLQLNWKLLLLGFGVAVFSSALPVTLDMLSMKKLTGKTFSVLQSLQPAFGALSGLLFLGEYLTLRQWLAIGCIMTASTGAALYAKEKTDLLK